MCKVTLRESHLIDDGDERSDGDESLVSGVRCWWRNCACSSEISIEGLFKFEDRVAKIFMSGGLFELQSVDGAMGDHSTIGSVSVLLGNFKEEFEGEGVIQGCLVGWNEFEC